MLNILRKQMKWVMAIIVVAFLLSTFLMYEGRSTRRTPGRNADGTITDYEVATINGRSLMRSEIERRLRDYLNTYSSRSALSIDMGELYQAVFDQAVLEAQLAKEVEDSGIRVSDAEADRAMKDYADTYYPTRETFYQALAQSGIKIDDYKRSLARQMAVEQLLRNAVGEIVISEDRAVEFYDTMKSLLYSRPEGFNVHLADFRTSADAEVLYSKLIAGESWDIIASNDELASQDVLNITKSPVFLPSSTFSTGALSVIASLDVGTPSPVFEMSSNDYAVALKTSHVDATVSPYEEVSGDIKGMLTNQEERNRITAYQNSLMEKAQVVINDQELFARPVISEDTVTENNIVPEIIIEEASEDTPAPSIVIEEVKEDSDEPESEAEVIKVEETPEPEPEEPASEQETSPAEEKPSEPEPEPEAIAIEDTQEEPAIEQKTSPTEEKPSEPKPEPEAAVVEEVITKTEDIPLQEDITEEIIAPEKVAEEITKSSDAEEVLQ